jgi:peptidoglycan hydrolase-like protein with peptidoglycan-binding domain
MQEMLNAVGYNCGKADGIFGSGTRSALVNFQKANGLTADGIYGTKSRAKLEEVYNCKPSEVKPQQTANTSVVEGQKFLGVTADGIVGANTRKAYARYVQTALNADYSVGLTVDGIIGNATIRALGNHYVKKGERQNLVKVVQCGLSLLGYSVNGIDGIFGSGLENAVRSFQASKGLSADGIAGKNTIINIWKALRIY